MACCAISPRCFPLCRYWRLMVIYLTPLVLLPIPLLVEGQEFKCAYVMLLMAIYWCTEAMAIEMTSLLPIVLFPMLGILPAKEVMNSYLNDTTMMFTGGLMVALAVEKCNLHRRIALGVLSVVGTKPALLMLGFMLPTWFLSMWISNTATTAMMLPIMEAVLQSLEVARQSVPPPDHNGVVVYENEAFDEVTKEDTVSEKQDINMVDLGEAPTETQDDAPDDPDSPRTSARDPDGGQSDSRFLRFGKGMSLSVAYAANCGGIATLTGTPPNAILKGAADEVWIQQGYVESPITFASWMVVGAPVSALSLIVVWIWLVLFFAGPRAFRCCGENTDGERAAQVIISREKSALGRWSFAEIMMTLTFVALVSLWFFRTPSFLRGWAAGDPFQTGFVTDAVAVILIVLILCAIPFELPNCRQDTRKQADTLLDWKTILKKLPWGIILLLGGGFALAAGSNKSGLSAWIAQQLVVFRGWNQWGLVAMICLLVAFLTEITSNSATCTILMPIMSSLSQSIGKSPLFLMIPAAIATSFAFMLPVATPPNAIVFSFGRLRIIDMIKGGFILNFLCVGIVTLATNLWANVYYDLDVPLQNMTSTT